MILVLLGFVFLIFGLISWWCYEFFKHNPYLRKYNGPCPIPIFGSSYKIATAADVIPVFMEYIKAYGPVIKLWIGFRPRIIISDYKTAELLLNSKTILDKSYDYKFIEGWLGTGLLTSTGSKWKRQRRLLTPAFHIQILKRYIRVFNNESDVLRERLNKVVNTGPVNIYPFISLCALDIIYESVMGIQIHVQEKCNTNYVNTVAEIIKITLARMYSIFVTYNSVYKLTTNYKREKEATKFLHEHTNFVITSTEKEFFNSSKDLSEKVNGLGLKTRMAFLDLLLECRDVGATLTTENIREEVDTFMFAGHDTTSSAMAFTLYCLSINQAIQEKAVEEIQRLLGNNDVRTPTYRELQEMKYLEMVIKESMRMYPPVPIIARELSDDTEFGDIILPKGVNLTLFSYGLHRQEKMFPDPEKFDPERFLPENSAKRSPFSYVPFSAGIRNCIGQRFAMLAIKSVLSKILLNFQILPVEGYNPELTTEAVLRSKMVFG